MSPLWRYGEWFRRSPTTHTCTTGSTWLSLNHGGGAGMGFSQHSGMVIVCDGTEAAAKRIAGAVERPCDRGDASCGCGV